MKYARSAGTIAVCVLLASLSVDAAPVLARHHASPAPQAATALQLPVGAFSPASVTSSFVLENTNTDLHSSSFWPRAFHSVDYDTWGRKTGYYQDAVWQPSGAPAPVTFDYSGSIFGTASGAHTAWQDGSSYLLKFSGVTSAQCPAGSATSCTRMTLPTTTNSTSVYYDVIQVNRCLIEDRGYTSTSSFPTYSSQISQTLASIESAAVSLARKACGASGTPPTPLPTLVPTSAPAVIHFTIISARIEKLGAKPDWKQVRLPRTKIKRLTKAQLVLYFDVTSAPANEPYSVHWQVHDGNRTILDRVYPRTLNNTPVSIWRDWVPLTVTRLGHYSATGTISMGNVVQPEKLTFQVVRKRPLAPRPVSFTFDSLYTSDQAGHRVSAFKVETTVGVVYTYTVRNVKGTVPIAVIRTYRRQASQGWVPIGHPVPEIGDTSNGTHTVRVFSVPNPTVPFQQILVGITIGGSHQEKAVTFTVHK